MFVSDRLKHYLALAGA